MTRFKRLHQSRPVAQTQFNRRAQIPQQQTLHYQANDTMMVACLNIRKPDVMAKRKLRWLLRLKNQFT